MSSNPCIYMDYKGGDHLNGRLWLRAAVRRNRSKSVCASLACCCLG